MAAGRSSLADTLGCVRPQIDRLGRFACQPPIGRDGEKLVDRRFLRPVHSPLDSISQRFASAVCGV